DPNYFFPITLLGSSGELIKASGWYGDVPRGQTRQFSVSFDGTATQIFFGQDANGAYQGDAGAFSYAGITFGNLLTANDTPGDPSAVPEPATWGYIAFAGILLFSAR